jgi:catechol 2,3-dioxygenase-like lactoylglutathione lyase family enzyme
MRFLGIDHVDLRVPSLGAVERFYDALAERLGLPSKGYANVQFGGASWDDGTPENYNAVEYFSETIPGRPRMFFGVIEEASAQPSPSRVAFAVAADELDEWEGFLRRIGARDVERGSPEYPAVFFTDPLGTRLEVCARRPAP